MTLAFSSSIRQRTVLGFLLVVLPLLFALISTMFRVDRMAIQMHETLQRSAQSVEFSRLISNQVLSMERSAEQFVVLSEPDLLLRYEVQRKLLADNIGKFTKIALPDKLLSQINRLVNQEKALYQQLQQYNQSVSDNSASQAELEAPTINLAKTVGPIPPAVMTLVTESSANMQARIERVQELLFWQAVALIPLALLAAIVFSVLITRPLKQITGAVKRLGSGNFNTAVTVSGPEDVRKLGDQLDWMRQKLAEIDLQKQNFLQHVSHELKTPLTTIREGTELLKDGVVGDLNQGQIEVVEIMRDNSLKLQSQVESLLNFNFALSQEGLKNSQAVDLDKIVSAVIEKHQLTTRTRDIELVARLEPLQVSGVADHLETVVDNMISNAIKYSPDHSEICMTLSRNNGLVQLDVKDQGKGINAEDQEQIFEPFYQGEQISKGPLKGTGLGLAIAQRYIGLHDGTIKVIQADAGAHFRMQLPAYDTAKQTIN